MTLPVIDSFGPERSWVPPGGALVVKADIHASAPCAAQLTLSLHDLDREVATVQSVASLGPEPTHLELELRLPMLPRHGYGLVLRVEVGETVATAHSAVEALDGWWQSPRHAAITRYEASKEAAASMRDLVAWHVTVVQHYDWMWRHYRYRPPDGASIFRDALGRPVSHDAVRAAIGAGHEVGISSLAYGSVYGAEPDYIARHPDERVFDDAGEPLSLGGMFFITDLRPSSPWRERLLDEYDTAIVEFGFDGVHMDTYGSPHTATSADGEAIDFAALYPDLIDEAADRVARAGAGARVLFNCVDGFPLESIAPSRTSCLYLELWPPDRAFADVVRWIDRAKGLASGRQVVIAAYAATLRDEAAVTDRQEAMEAAVLLGAVIAASGAYHHTLTEDDRLLVEGYYPAAAALRPAEVIELRPLWAFTARYVHLLSDPELVLVDPAGLDISDEDGNPVAWSVEPVAGAVWVRASQTSDGRRVLHLIDLREQDDDRWDWPKRLPRVVNGLRLEWPGISEPLAASPWVSEGDPIPMRPSRGGWLLPRFRRWSMVVEATTQ